MSMKLFLRIACIFVILIAALTMVVSTVQAQAPANDNFANATIISNTPYEDSLDNFEATVELNEPTPECWSAWPYPGDLDYHTVWYTFTPVENGMIQGNVDHDFTAGLAVYTGSGLSSITEIGCWRGVWEYIFNVQAGVTYYFQIGSIQGQTGWMNFHLDIIPAPANDNFLDAMMVSLGDNLTVDNSAASVEPGEPWPGCASLNKTIWFTYTPAESEAVTVQADAWWKFVAAYTGSDLNNLQEIGCRSHGYPLPLQLEGGVTYYFQAGAQFDWSADRFTFRIFKTPPPSAEFGWNPGDPNNFETVEFCDWSSDPVNIEFEEFQWDFGDGVTTTGNCVYHRYPTDGDYTVWHNVQTSDGRTDPDGVTHTVQVRTHDVVVVRVAAPKSASAGQTRQITVYIKNIRYLERVEIQLFKSVPGGFEWVATTNQNIPVRSGNRTTAVNFSYTFTQSDADIGKVTFKAVATLIDARDALPGDNEAISPPTKVSR